MKQGEHPKMPDPQCIKTYYQTKMMPKSTTKYGPLLRPNAQIVALRAHCTRTTLKATSTYGTQCLQTTDQKGMEVCISVEEGDAPRTVIQGIPDTEVANP